MRDQVVRTLTAAVLLAAALAWAGGSSDAPAREDGASAELQGIYEADQADRSRSTPPSQEEWKEITSRDGVRRDRAVELVRSGALETAADYFHAAMVLQHGKGAEDILVAHVLATVAGFKGHERGRWLSAAALDRYLHRTDRPQILGTQYVRSSPDEPWSQGDYDPWLPDTIRAEFGVPPLAAQGDRVREMNGSARRE